MRILLWTFILTAAHAGADDAYTTLGVARDADTATIRQAYLVIVTPLYRAIQTGAASPADARLVAANLAYARLKRPESRAAYDRESAVPVPDAPQIFTDALGDRTYRTGRGTSFNRSKPVSYWRAHPDQNFLLYAARPPAAISREPATARRRLDRWFAEPDAVEHADRVRQWLEKTSPEEVPELAAQIAEASLRRAVWRQAGWISELMAFPTAIAAVTRALTTPELVHDEVLAAALLDDPEFRFAHYFEWLLPQGQSVKVGDRVQRLIAAQLQDEYGPSFFLRYGGQEAHWILGRPDVVEYALTHIHNVSTLADLVIRQVLTQPESARHPEWLAEVLRRPDPYNFLEKQLNQVLALDHWFHQPQLREVLKGQAPTVEGLRRAYANPRPALVGAQAAAGKGWVECVAFLMDPWGLMK